MAEFEEIYWTKTNPISIRDYASYCGFNLNTIDLFKIPEDQRKWIERKVVGNILEDLDECWAEDEWEEPFNSIEKGVYVISLAGNICVDYKNKPSQVIYIGRGQVRHRIYNHLKNWVANFSESLQDINFRFWATKIKKAGSPDAFKIVESKLIKIFYDRYGELPILNKKFGDCFDNSNHSFSKDLTKPFRNERAINKGWKIRPMESNEWFKEIEEDI